MTNNTEAVPEQAVAADDVTPTSVAGKSTSLWLPPSRIMMAATNAVETSVANSKGCNEKSDDGGESTETAADTVETPVAYSKACNEPSRIMMAATNAVETSVANSKKCNEKSDGGGESTETATDTVETSVAYSKACNERRVCGGDSGWKLQEEITLVKHMQNVFEPNFDALKIRSLLQNKSDEDIKEKWKKLVASLLPNAATYLRIASKQKQDDEDEGSDSDAKEDRKVTSPQRKKQKVDSSTKKWTQNDLERLIEIMKEYTTTTPKWGEVASNFSGKTPVDCLTQWQRMSLPRQVKGKGSWTPGEDDILLKQWNNIGNKWSKIAAFLPGRAGKQCRERFMNHLDPSLKKGEWTDDEEALLIALHKHHGNKWTLISKNLTGRSDNDVKNHWYSTITRKFQIHGKDKLTVAAVQQVFMLVTAGMISQDLVKDWPGASNICQSYHPPPHQYWYGATIPPGGYMQQHPLPHSMPNPYYPQEHSDGNEGEPSQPSFDAEESEG